MVTCNGNYKFFHGLSLLLGSLSRSIPLNNFIVRSAVFEEAVFEEAVFEEAVFAVFEEGYNYVKSI